MVLFLLFHCCCCQASFPNDVAARTTWHKEQFGMEATMLTALMLTRMLIVISLEGYCQSPGTTPYVFLCRSQPTTNPQCLLTHCDLNGWQWPPWCPTPGADTDNTCPECWRIVVSSCARSGAPWRPWEGGGRHGQWDMVWLALASFYLAKTHITTQNNQLIRLNRQCANNSTITSIGDHLIIQHADGLQDHLQLAPPHISLIRLDYPCSRCNQSNYKFVVQLQICRRCLNIQIMTVNFMPGACSNRENNQKWAQNSTCARGGNHGEWSSLISLFMFVRRVWIWHGTEFIWVSFSGGLSSGFWYKNKIIQLCVSNLLVLNWED